MVISTTVGGGYDIFGRMFARHMGKYLPGGNARFAVKNMPGAGGLVATNHMFNVAERDGSTIAVVSREALTEPLLVDRTDAGQVRSATFRVARFAKSRSRDDLYIDRVARAIDRGRPATRSNAGHVKRGKFDRRDGTKTPERAHRDEVQGDHRISRIDGIDPGDGAKRGRWPILAGLGGAGSEQGQRSRCRRQGAPDRLPQPGRQPCFQRSSQCHGSRNDSGVQTDSRRCTVEPRSRAAVLRAARRARRSCQALHTRTPHSGPKPLSRSTSSVRHAASVDSEPGSNSQSSILDHPNVRNDLFKPWSFKTKLS